jgi:MFS family permease
MEMAMLTDGRPVIGGFAAQHKGWRWSQWCMLFISLTVFLLAFGMRETFKPILLARRAKKLGITPPEAVSASKRSAKSAVIQNFVRPLHMLLTEVTFFLPQIFVPVLFCSAYAYTTIYSQ